MSTSWSLARFTARLRRLAQEVERRDPAGSDAALRVSVAFGLYSAFDALRCQDAPFDRDAFAGRLQAAERLVAAIPPAGRGRRARRLASGDPEAVVAELYSRCWAHYDDEAFLRTIDLFAERFRLNGVTLEFLRGAHCLDAGCGSGRYAMAMARLGAASAVGIDISERAIREARQRWQRLELPGRVEFVRGSVIAMPAAWSGRFDFICSNGVVHHTKDPEGGLREIFRTLKPGGRAYVFVYGAGGLFWALVDAIRGLVAPVPMAWADLFLQSLGIGPGKIFNAMDHWYTPIQERLTRREFEARLRRSGFEAIEYLPRAMVYDASERRHRFPEERDLVGEGDLRYLVRKPLAGMRARRVRAAVA